MSTDSDTEAVILENVSEVMDGLSKEVQELYTFRDLFFENHPIELAAEKNKFVEEKKNKLVEKFEEIDVDTQIPFDLRAQFLFWKGRCYNISSEYDTRATQCLSKAVKLNPRLIEAWNELGECYWKNTNVKEAKASFEGALKHHRNRLSLRCLSIIIRQECANKKGADAFQSILKSVELAKEAVSQNTKDGQSWAVLANAYLCQFFTMAQDPAILKLCMSAFKQAWLDPVTKGQPDLYYNKATALKFEELYEEALENFEYACRLDPPWELPKKELAKLKHYLAATDELVRTKGKIKTKKLTQMVQSIDERNLGEYSPDALHTFGKRKNVTLERTQLSALVEGSNEGKVVLGRVVGSIHNENSVPFTFALVDDSMQCVCVNVYNWADGRGTIIGDCVAIPEPYLTIHKHGSTLPKYDFKSIRVNNPMELLVNGKRIGRNQFACTRVTSTYEIQ
ncbi:hypothetical protein K1T71_011767 [Dendrolimus kikuchii]|uniref:Uncharacterized protein n=1 Tax=Dendrolimus kikuchii TaxID=765133 RepID=A0ACC1CM12_9NEOP|nr:hypothetical protein K1T71_011767 [Dendrolimus kikuchii]